MVVPEQVLHSVLVLTWDAEDMADTAAAALSALKLSADDRMDAVAHINEHRGEDGGWGGRAEDVENRARERVQFALDEGMLPSEFESIVKVPEEEEEDDVFAALGVQSPSESAAAAGDALEAFMDGEEEEEVTAEPVVESDEDDDDDDEDPFAALGVSGPAVALAELDPDDPLAALMDDEDDEEEEAEEEVEAEVEAEEEAPAEATIDALAAYRLVLDTVWVDGVLDPGEVSLLARRRAELELSFEDHLALVRDMLG